MTVRLIVTDRPILRGARWNLPGTAARDGPSVMEVGHVPKELLYSAESLRYAATAVVEHIAVGWTKDRSVQIGVIQGPPVELTINGKPADPGLWMDLDRDGCNRLIRSLRKARDSAYGADA